MKQNTGGPHPYSKKRSVRLSRLQKLHESPPKTSSEQSQRPRLRRCFPERGKPDFWLFWLVELSVFRFTSSFWLPNVSKLWARYDAMLETWSNTQCTIVVSFNWLPSSHANLFTLPPFTKISLRVQVHPSTLDLEGVTGFWQNQHEISWNFNVTFDHSSKHFDRSWVNFVYFFGIFCLVIAFWCVPACTTKPLEIRAIQIGADPGPLMSKPACNHSSRVSLANLATKTRMLEAGCFSNWRSADGTEYDWDFRYLIMLLNIMPTKKTCVPWYDLLFFLWKVLSLFFPHCFYWRSVCWCLLVQMPQSVWTTTKL